MPPVVRGDLTSRPPERGSNDSMYIISCCFLCAWPASERQLSQLMDFKRQGHDMSPRMDRCKVKHQWKMNSPAWKISWEVYSQNLLCIVIIWGGITNMSNLHFKCSLEAHTTWGEGGSARLILSRPTKSSTTLQTTLVPNSTTISGRDVRPRLHARLSVTAARSGEQSLQYLEGRLPGVIASRMMFVVGTSRSPLFREPLVIGMYVCPRLALFSEMFR